MTTTTTPQDTQLESAQYTQLESCWRYPRRWILTRLDRGMFGRTDDESTESIWLWQTGDERDALKAAAAAEAAQGGYWAQAASETLEQIARIEHSLQTHGCPQRVRPTSSQPSPTKHAGTGL